MILRRITHKVTALFLALALIFGTLVLGEGLTVRANGGDVGDGSGLIWRIVNGSTLVIELHNDTSSPPNMPDWPTPTVPPWTQHSSSITNVILSDDVMNIGNNAFTGLVNLRNMTIGNGVTIIEPDTFAGLNDLRSVTIGGGVESIAPNTFKDLPSLRTVTLKGDVIYIGAGAFENTDLRNFTIPPSFTNIGSRAFANTGLASVTIPAGVTDINDEVFADNSNLRSVSIPNSVITIGDRAFANTGLTSVTIPASVTSIGDGAFAKNSSLRRIEVSGTDQSSRYFDIDGILYERSPFNPQDRTLVQYPTGRTNTNFTIPAGTISIGAGAFEGNIRLRTVTIPNSVTNIRERAFKDTRLSGIEIPASVTIIGNSAFEASSITEAAIEENVISIGARAFADTHLKSIRIPDSVASIGTETFSGSIHLTSAIIGSGVANIPDRMFDGCTKLSKVYFSSIIPPGVGSYAFRGLESGAQAIVPNTWGDNHHFSAILNEGEPWHGLTIKFDTTPPQLPPTIIYGFEVNYNTETIKIVRKDGTDIPANHDWTNYNYVMEVNGRITVVKPLFCDTLDISQFIQRAGRTVKIAIVERPDFAPPSNVNGIEDRYAGYIVSEIEKLNWRGNRVRRRDIDIDYENERIVKHLNANYIIDYEFRTAKGSWQPVSLGYYDPANLDATIDISGFKTGGIIEIRRAPTDATAAGPVMRIRIKSRPHINSSKIQLVNNGFNFRGVTSNMKYMIVNADGNAALLAGGTISDWTDVTSNNMTVTSDMQGRWVHFQIPANPNNNNKASLTHRVWVP